MRFVMLVTNNEGGQPATLHNSLVDAVSAVRAYLTDPENNPPQDEEERSRMERDLLEVSEEYVSSIQGSDAWKEWVYIAPVQE